MSDQALSPAKARRRDSNHKRFQRVAERRANQILDKLRVLGNCSNPYQYAYSDEEVDRMFAAIQAEVDRVRALFEPQKREKPQPFKF